MKLDKSKIQKIVIISILSLIAIWWIYTRYIISEEAKIKKTIRAVQSASKEMDTNTIMKYIARDYHDKEELTRQDIFRILFRYERIYSRVEIKIFTIDINIFNELGKKTALVDIIASVNAYSKSEVKVIIFKKQSERYLFKIKFQKDGNTWKIIEYLDHQPVLK